MGTDPDITIRDIARRKALFAVVRDRAESMQEAGISGRQIAEYISNGIQSVLKALIEEVLVEFPSQVATIRAQGALVALGGLGRKELAPFSDIDLLFLHRQDETPEFDQFVNRFVQICWDSGMRLGHAVRDITRCVRLSIDEPQIATALIEATCLWGNSKLVDQLKAEFREKVIVGRQRKFIDDCLAARVEGWSQEGPLAQELEPDVKASAGGLRDLHLIRWVAFAAYGVRELDELEKIRVLSAADVKKLKDGWEFLVRVRVALHLHANRPQDRLTRDEQLRISREWGIEETDGQRAVEKFMQEYFLHSSEISTICHRFVALQQPKTVWKKLRDQFFGQRADGFLFITPDEIQVAPRNLKTACSSLESILRIYRASAMFDLPIAPEVKEAIKEAVPTLDAHVSAESAKTFLEIFRFVKPLGPTLRGMFNTGVLDLLIPEVTRIRNLLQFNQYHHFTVDEHTLRAVETVTKYETDQSAIGIAYRAIRQKELIHLAVFLHDIGKGYERDHCLVGEEIAVTVCTRLRLALPQVEQVAFLVRHHLEMADLAWRRDISDPNVILSFSWEIGSPDTLRMLFVLTAADVTSVGPGTWTDWKASLLSEFYESCLAILSGKRYSDHESARLRSVKDDVTRLARTEQQVDASPSWISGQLEGFSANYLITNSAEQIVADLNVLKDLNDKEVRVTSNWLPSTGSCEYRIITLDPQAIEGCFYRMCGLLTAKRLTILSADINTTSAGAVIDSYQVIDTDYQGMPPQERFDDVAEMFSKVLQGDVTVESLFTRSRRFVSKQNTVLSDLPTRIKIDNDSSESRTIIDVFAHDRPGLLYTLARTLYELQLSIDLAKISTHFDQVIDVFYVQELNGQKVTDTERLTQIRDRLEAALQHFEQFGHKQFLS